MNSYKVTALSKAEKEIAAIYLSACLDQMRYADTINDEAAKEQAETHYKEYRNKLKALLEMKFEMFGLDYSESVMKSLQEVYKITQVFYSQRVNNQPMKYPA